MIYSGFIHGHQSRPTENHLHRTEEIPKVAQTTGTVDVSDPRQAFRDPLREELPHVQIFMNDGPSPLTEVPSCSAIDLAEILLSSKISW